MHSVVYVFDSLRYDRATDSSVMPNIDDLRSDAVGFSSAYSQGIWTVPSSAAIFSGEYPETHNSNQFNESLSKSLPRITDDMSEITTACFSTSNVVSSDRGFDQGFDEFYDIGRNGTSLQPNVMVELNRKLIPWVEKHAEEDFFVLVWAMGPHHPYLTPDDVESDRYISNNADTEGTSEWARRLPVEDVSKVTEYYDSCVRHSDSKFGDLLDVLKDQAIYEDSQIVVTSDHGEIFNEHARLENTHQGINTILPKLIPESLKQYFGLFSPRAFVGHQAIDAYSELVHVPLIVKQPSISSRESDSLVELIDIAPTVASYFGNESSNFTGFDLSEQVSDENREAVYSSSQIDRGPLIYRSIRDRDKVHFQKELKLEKIDWTEARSIQSVLTYLISKKEVAVHSDNEDEKCPMSSNLSKNLENIVVEANQNAKDAESVELSDETMSHLEDLGYR